MKQAISFVTLGVRDLARSRAFYKALGWRESSGSQAEVAFFQAGSTAFALFGRASLAEDANVSPQGSGFPGFTLAHNVPAEEAVDATLREAVAAGGRLARPGEKAPWGGFRGTSPTPTVFSGKSVSIPSSRSTGTGSCGCRSRGGVAGKVSRWGTAMGFLSECYRPVTVIPGPQSGTRNPAPLFERSWIPAFAGMTTKGRKHTLAVLPGLTFPCGSKRNLQAEYFTPSRGD